MRTTKRMLGVRLGYLNRRLGSSYRLEKSEFYNGWVLVAEDNTIINAGLGAKEMLTYIDGLIVGIWMKEGAYQ